MQKLLSGPRALALATCAVLALSVSANADIVFNTTTAASGAGSTQNTQHYLQQVHLRPGRMGSHAQQLPCLSGINWTGSAGGPDCGVLLNFYTNLNLAPGATNVLTGATQFGSVGFLTGNPGMERRFSSLYPCPDGADRGLLGATFGRSGCS